jgi:hypothetical protein
LYALPLALKKEVVVVIGYDDDDALAYYLYI